MRNGVRGKWCRMRSERSIEAGRRRHLHVRGYKEEETTTTPFDMTVRNDLDRFHLVTRRVRRVPHLRNDGRGGGRPLQDHARRTRAVHVDHGDDMPVIRDWRGAGYRGEESDRATDAESARKSVADGGERLGCRRHEAQYHQRTTVHDGLAINENFVFPVASANHLDVDVELTANPRRHTGGVQSGHSIRAIPNGYSRHGCSPR